MVNPLFSSLAELGRHFGKHLRRYPIVAGQLPVGYVSQPQQPTI